MLNLPIIRWGQPYESLETSELTHFLSGEPVACVAQANAGLVERDIRKAPAAREALRAIAPDELIARVGRAGELFRSGVLAIGDTSQSPADFVRCQSATTGLPEQMCRANMEKNCFVLSNMGRILDALTRGLDLSILARGFGVESRGVTVSYQAQTPVLGLVLPSNSPGVHTLWLPVIPLQIGLVLKPGSQEPWTAYRMAAAFVAAGIPAESISIYPGGHDVGNAIVSRTRRSMIFGGQQTVDKYRGNPGVQVHGPGFSKILLGDDVVDRWEEYLDLMVTSVVANGGRSCINASGIWASRHTREIAAAMAERLGAVEVKPPDDPAAPLAAFTDRAAAVAIWRSIEADLRESGVTHATADFGPRLVELERCAYLRPTVAHCAGPQAAIARKEFMFPLVSVVECPQDKMLATIGPTLVCTAITDNERFQQQLADATEIDRLNIGPIPTTQLDWLQPHEGNLIEFLYRNRAYQRRLEA
ncbi:MAG: aldehyde dehydrogenase family protein [Planctomycetia bacterium]|nr:aldehyde dehydrogenase family protein [Planctomycetia bacterium]